MSDLVHALRGSCVGMMHEINGSGFSVTFCSDDKSID